ncbi:MAG: NUDIX hydrolase [Bacteroidales bacterium]|nr:NUDIX hydrolase [Bacteroidales bacterium]
MKDQNIKLAVDAVVFGYKDDGLFVLLVKQKYGPFINQWVLPGGFVKHDEALIDAVYRELLEETNVELDYLEQLYTFGDDIKRDPRFRVVSVAYLGLVNPKRVSIKPDTDALDVAWFRVDNIEILPFDHKLIIDKGIERLQSKLNYKPIGFDLLDDEFVFSDLENLYRTILCRDIDRRNFRKKILSFGILEETKKVKSVGSGRPGKVYTFNKVKYKELEESGFVFEIKFA